MRRLLDCERPLAGYLFELAGLPVDLDALRVEPMEDGGMGGLAIQSPGGRYGSSAAECHFHDSDGELVSVVLNLDEVGAPFEIDVFKVDFSPLLTWPARADLRAGPPCGMPES
ncbi:DUF6984 family protein [Marilutibacter maris]|uniref:Putative integron gene cassette protein n=1 Tax=Marilutibacter maris TaxID=1605891 RepID=A0A2U9TGQ9_9GAMM|nr:hypothetical protein [Lysobacter maris]AWV08829.1 putative integron gene cassette protein [Lysobacter maris]